MTIQPVSSIPQSVCFCKSAERNKKEDAPRGASSFLMDHYPKVKLPSVQWIMAEYKESLPS